MTFSGLADECDLCGAVLCGDGRISGRCPDCVRDYGAPSAEVDTSSGGAVTVAPVGLSDPDGPEKETPMKCKTCNADISDYTDGSTRCAVCEPVDPSAPSYAPLAALAECDDLWASGAWPDSNAVHNLAEVMGHVERLLRKDESSVPALSDDHVVVVFDITPGRGRLVPAERLVDALAASAVLDPQGPAEGLIESWWIADADLKRADRNDMPAMRLVDDSCCPDDAPCVEVIGYRHPDDDTAITVLIDGEIQPSVPTFIIDPGRELGVRPDKADDVEAAEWRAEQMEGMESWSVGAREVVRDYIGEQS